MSRPLPLLLSSYGIFPSVALILALASPWTACATEPPDDGLGWTLVRLDLTIDVLPPAGKITGRATMRLRLDRELSHGPRLALAATGAPMAFRSLTGPPGSRTRLDDDSPTDTRFHYARLQLVQPVERGFELELEVEFESDGRRSDQFVIEERAGLASWVTAWYPVPDFGADRSLSEMMTAPGTTVFRLPPGWMSVSNGQHTRRAEAEGDEVTVETWTVDPPVARSFTVGPFATATHDVDARRIHVYLLHQSADGAQAQARTLAQALRAQEAVFGPYPYDAYAVVEIPEGIAPFYASSEQGFVMAKTGAFEAAHGNLPLFAHEMAHGWWGNLVGARGASTLWVTESLAQLGAFVAIESIEGPRSLNEFLEFSRDGYSPLQCANGYFTVALLGGDRPVSALGSGRFDHDLSDSKGAWIYHMLRRRIGDETFFSTLRSLLERHGGATMTIDDVRSAFIRSAPGYGLEDFFEQWLDRAGAPVLSLDWWATEKDDGTLGLHAEITQQQDGDPFALDLELGIDVSSGDRLYRTVQIENEKASFDIKMGRDRPLNVEVDPNRNLLLWRPYYGPRPNSTVQEAEHAPDSRVP